MPLNIPLPEAPPGGFSGGTRAINELAASNLANQIAKVKAQYAPLTTQAEAASKLAYANLMGPQFLAKLMGNESIQANIADPKKREILQKLYGAGMSGDENTLNALPGINQTNPLSGGLLGLLLSAFNNQPKSTSSSGAGAQVTQQPPSQQTTPSTAVQGQNQLLTPSAPTPVETPSLSPTPTSQTSFPNQPTWAENIGTHKGMISEGEEAGKIRAKDISELNNTYFNAQTLLTSTGKLADIIATPAFRELRQIPYANQHEINYYLKNGTPQQKYIAGQYLSTLGTLVQNFVTQFKGNTSVKELNLADLTKPNPGDMPDAAAGKVESMHELTQMVAERSRLTSELMSRYHINKLEAAKMADKLVNGDAIRESIHDRLYPTVTITNTETGEQKTVPIKEAREKYGVKT